ncbi:MAG: hypothetical protein K9H16_14225 [Bacteroidales bacterium]|nr:hypothetical protein [Bacteroidales bacterium]
MKNTFVFFTIILFCTGADAQISASANFVKGGQNDAAKIMSSYLQPIERALLYNGANNNLLIFKQEEKTNLRLGIGLDLSFAFVNHDDLTFDLNTLNLEEFEPADPQQTLAQSISGNENTIVLQTRRKYYVPSSGYPFYASKPILSLNSPEGSNQKYLLYPLIHFFAEKQGNVVEFKALPPVKINSSTIKMSDIGLNIQHNLETSLNFIADLWFDIYITCGFNSNRLSYYLDIIPDEETLTFSLQSNNGPYDNQELQIHSKSFPLKINLVKQKKNISFSLGGGYNFTTSEVKLAGNYPLYAADPTNLFQIIVTDFEDPVEYTHRFNKLSVDASVSYRNNHISAGLKYSQSFYKNLALTFGYMF